MRDFLKGLDLDKETIDSIMAEYGKNVQGMKEEIEKCKVKISDYETKINDLSSKAEDNSKANEELKILKQEIAEKKEQEKAKHDDEILTQNIVASFGDKKFVNDFTKQAIVNEVKSALKDENNLGKSAKDIFEELTKDKEGIFSNPNQVQDMPSMGDVPPGNEIDKAKFNKMGYKARVELKNKNPKLYEELNKEE